MEQRLSVRQLEVKQKQRSRSKSIKLERCETNSMDSFLETMISSLLKYLFGKPVDFQPSKTIRTICRYTEYNGENKNINGYSNVMMTKENTS